MWSDKELQTALALLAVSCDQRSREVENGRFDDADRHKLADELIEFAQDARPGAR